MQRRNWNFIFIILTALTAQKAHSITYDFPVGTETIGRTITATATAGSLGNWTIKDSVETVFNLAAVNGPVTGGTITIGANASVQILNLSQDWSGVTFTILGSHAPNDQKSNVIIHNFMGGTFTPGTTFFHPSLSYEFRVAPITATLTADLAARFYALTLASNLTTVGAYDLELNGILRGAGNIAMANNQSLTLAVGCRSSARTGSTAVFGSGNISAFSAGLGATPGIVSLGTGVLTILDTESTTVKAAITITVAGSIIAHGPKTFEGLVTLGAPFTGPEGTTTTFNKIQTSNSVTPPTSGKMKILEMYR